MMKVTRHTATRRPNGISTKTSRRPYSTRYCGEYAQDMSLSDYIEAFFEEEGINAKLRYAEYDEIANRIEIGWEEGIDTASTIINGMPEPEKAFEIWKADRETQLDYLYSEEE